VSDGGVRVEVALLIPADELLSIPEPQRRAILDGLADVYEAAAAERGRDVLDTLPLT
jgi:hypothetical protein